MPVWKNDVEKLFTKIDIDHMKARGVFLDNYQFVKSNFPSILSKIENDTMPPGDPWPADWREKFKQWRDEGFPLE